MRIFIFNILVSFLILFHFHFDFFLAKYNADDDYYAKKKPKAFAEGISNDHPICEQPGRQDGAPIR